MRRKVARLKGLTMLLPLPNERFDSGTVIASMILNDYTEDGSPLMYRLIILRDKSFYYDVIETENGVITYRQHHENISDAVSEFVEG